MLSGKSNKLPTGKKRGFSNWIIQILIWIFIISFIISKKFESSTNNLYILSYILITCFIINYILYILSNILFSKTFLFLLDKNKSKTLKEILLDLTTKLPKITISINCYHIGNKEINDDSNINSEEEYENINNLTNESFSDRITTYNESKEFQYYSCRDISGEINLDNNINKKNEYLFVELNIKFDIIFGDIITMYDYDIFKNQFFIENRWRDVHLNLEEKKEIESDYENKIIKIDNTNIKFFNWELYLIFLFFGLIEFYKLSFEKYVIVQDYTIRKIISSRNKINQSDFKYLDAKIIYKGENILINENNETLINEDYIPKKITQKEINDSKKYEALLDNIFKEKTQENISFFPNKYIENNYNNNIINEDKSNEN